MDISDLLAFSVKNKASDLHLSAGMPPMIRVHGDVRKINVPVMDHSQVHDIRLVRGGFLCQLKRNIENASSTSKRHFLATESSKNNILITPADTT